MKRNYISPAVIRYSVAPQRMLAASDDVTSDGYVEGLTYGGVRGDLSPETKRYSVWDEDWSK